MNKTKTLKRKTTAFDVVYRIVTALMAVAMFPLAYFSKMLFIIVMHKDLSSLLNTLLGSEEQDPGGTYFEWAIADVFNPNSSLALFVNEDNFKDFDFSAVWENEYTRALFFAVVFFALTLVLGIVILGFAVFSNKTKVIACLSASGIVSMIISLVVFNMLFASPITSGQVSIGEALNISGLIANLAFGLVNVTTIKLEGGFFWVLFLMIAILIWSVSVQIVKTSDEKEKAEKAMQRARSQG